MLPLTYSQKKRSSAVVSKYQGRAVKIDGQATMSRKATTFSRRGEAPAAKRDRPLSKLQFEKLRQEAALLREEAHRVFAHSRELRSQFNTAVEDYRRLRSRMENRSPMEHERVLPIVSAAEKLLPQDESLRHLSRSLLEAIEEERRHIARELHDDLNQQIAWLHLKVCSLREGAASPPEMQEAERLMLAHGLDELSAKITRICRQLHPAILTDLGLEAAIRSFVADFAEHEKVTAVFRSREVPRNIPAPIGLCFYRILQEALRNISKHARTQRLAVTLSTTSADRLRLVVRDYGIGIPAGLRIRRNGLGLISMEERARLVNGSVSIRSGAGRGTQVTVEVPLKGPKALEHPEMQGTPRDRNNAHLEVRST